MKNIELYRDGFTVNEIRARNELKKDEVENLIESISADDLIIHKRNLKERIVDMYEAGYSINVINKKTSVSISIIKDYLGI